MIKTYIDENGEWLVEDNGVMLLVNPSEKWIADNPPEAPETTDPESRHIDDRELIGMMRAAGLIE